MDSLHFRDRIGFRDWLAANAARSGGVWLLFGKKDGPETLSADEAVEEALCFGWIDGRMRSLDDRSYVEYFSPRRRNSPWSLRNRTTAERLEREGKMTDAGRVSIEQAKRNGLWEAAAPSKASSVPQESLEEFTARLQGIEPACSHFMQMPPSVRRTYAAYYFKAKSEAARQRRFEKIMGRLHKNLRPMDREQ